MAVSTGSAPGKVILFGEHAVVHGASCIAASINLRTSASIHLTERQAPNPQKSHGDNSADEVVLALPGLHLEWRWQLEELQAIGVNLKDTSTAAAVAEASEDLTLKLKDLAKAAASQETSGSLIAGAAAFLFLHMNILGLRPSHTVLQSELPMGAGLGSSAAYCVSIAGAMLAAIRAPGFITAVASSTAEPSSGAPVQRPSAEESKPISGSCGPEKGYENNDLLRTGGPLESSDNVLAERPSASSDELKNSVGLQQGSSRGRCCPLESSPLEPSVPETSAATTSFQGADLANAWAFQAERIIHGRPSGVDNTVSCFGGAICYKKGAITRLPHILSLRMLLTNTNVGRDTKALVAGVGQRAARSPEVYEPLFKAIDGISQAFLDASADTAVDSKSLRERVEELVDLNQAILRGLGVSHPKIEDITAVTARQDLHSKLTGAGGGGCVLTLLQDLEEKMVRALIESLESQGFSCYQVTVGCPGLQWTAG